MMPIVTIRTLIDVDGDETVNPATLPDTIAAEITEAVTAIPGVVNVVVSEVVREDPEPADPPMIEPS